MMSKFFKLTSFLILIFIFLVSAKISFASTLNLSPSGGNISVGSTLNVSVRLNAGGDSVNGVSAVLSYPADKLDVAYINYGSAFSIAAEGTYGGGSIRISRANFSGVSGNVLVATIGFKGKSPGVATVSFIGGSAAPRAADSSDSLSLGGSSGATFNVGGAAAPAASAKATTAKIQTPAASVAPADALGPKILNVKVAEISPNSTTITWDTDEKSDSYVEYGLEKDNYFLNASDKIFTTTHKVKLEGPLLTPGARFHFKVSSRDTSGNTSFSEDATFQTKGYSVKIKVTDLVGNPIKNTDVYLYSEPLKGKTDQNGEVSFENVNAGRHLIVVKGLGGDKTKEIEVSKSDTPQNISVKVESSSIINANTLIPVILALVLIIVVLVILVIKKRRGSKATQSTTNSVSQLLKT